MNILIVKMSSFGDLIHTLPAITDASRALPGIRFDWVCEEPFRDVPRLHPQVEKVFCHGRLRWRKKRMARATLKEQYHFYKTLRESGYDAIIDAQGRVKSAKVSWLAKGPAYGLDKFSATDTETRFFYNHVFSIPKSVNATERIRILFARSLKYSLQGKADFGVKQSRLCSDYPEFAGSLILFHGTTWDSKYWLESEWIELISLARQRNIDVLLPWGNQKEQHLATRLTQQAGWGTVLPKLSIWELAGITSRCRGAIGVDTGLMHLAAAIGTPTVAIFGSTSTRLTGAHGDKVVNLQSSLACSPCMKKICPLTDNDRPPCYLKVPAHKVWETLSTLIKEFRPAAV